MAAQLALEAKNKGERKETCSHFALGGHKLSVFTHVALPLISCLLGYPSVVTCCVLPAARHKITALYHAMRQNYCGRTCGTNA